METQELVAKSESVQCATWTKGQEVDPIGTAGSYDTIALIEVPGKWPRDIGEIEEIAAVMDAVPMTRALGIRPERADDEQIRITVWRRANTARLEGVDYAISKQDFAADTLMSIVESGDHPSVLESNPAPAELVICGHGTRDRCCGREGVRLEMVVADRWPEVRVTRSSHLGGHRFAATAMTLPDGRAWAFLDPDVLDTVVAGDYQQGHLKKHLRGSTGFDAPAQVLERALLERHGPSWNDYEITSVDVAKRDDGWDVAIDWVGPSGAGRATGEIAVARVVPTPACGEPIEHAKKSAPELMLTSFDEN